ncbi:hypothetical protein MRX96_046927 [Rhipicephalus microplus]
MKPGREGCSLQEASVGGAEEFREEAARRRINSRFHFVGVTCVYIQTHTYAGLFWLIKIAQYVSRYGYKLATWEENFGLLGKELENKVRMKDCDMELQRSRRRRTTMDNVCSTRQAPVREALALRGARHKDCDVFVRQDEKLYGKVPDVRQRVNLPGVPLGYRPTRATGQPGPRWKGEEG